MFLFDTLTEHNMVAKKVSNPLTKAKSKRGTARQSFKIIKNVAETARKRRKEAKKNPKRTKAKKDPGIPNSFPFKEELLQQALAAKLKVSLL